MRLENEFTPCHYFGRGCIILRQLLNQGKVSMPTNGNKKEPKPLPKPIGLFDSGFKSGKDVNDEINKQISADDFIIF
jgi:hypothetical protein